MDVQFFPGQLIQFDKITRPPWYKRNIFYVVQKLGLDSGLQLCLDAGDATSLPASSQTWVDLSGQVTDFYRGTTSGAESSDPTINGTAGGLSNSEYLSFDGGDQCTMAVATPSFYQTLHKNNALFSIIARIYPSTPASAGYIFTTLTNAASQVGIDFLHFDSKLYFTAWRGSSNQALQVFSDATFSSNTWYNIGLVIDEAATTGFLVIDSAVKTFTSTYTSPSASNISIAPIIGRAFPSGTRCNILAMWDSALTQNNIAAIFDLLNRRGW